jgi:hypothetical protein
MNTADILQQSNRWTLLLQDEFVHVHVKHGDNSFFNIISTSELWDAITDLDLSRKQVEIIVPSDGDDSTDYWARFLKKRRFKVKRIMCNSNTQTVGVMLREWALRQSARATYH